ncbi:unnamed protein product [Malus baccata var. baccata]
MIMICVINRIWNMQLMIMMRFKSEAIITTDARLLSIATMLHIVITSVLWVNNNNSLASMSTMASKLNHRHST